MSKIRPGFLFDNDGVLIDSSEIHWQAWQLFMEEEASLNMTHQEFIDTFGKRNDLILKEISPASTIEQRKKWADRKEEIFRKRAQNAIKLLPGMERFLKEIQEKGYLRIIASSTPVENLKLFLSSTVLGKYFDKFVSADTVPHGKPFPDVFIKAAEEIGIPPEECIVLEDAPAGIEAGKRAGSFVVALGTTHPQENLENYDLFFQSPSDLNLQQILSAFHSRS